MIRFVIASLLGGRQACLADRQACLADRQGAEATNQSVQGNRQIAAQANPSVFSFVEATLSSR